MISRLFSGILRIFFYLLYHQFAWSYDWVANLVSIGRWQTWVFSVIPYLGGRRVLELGCGPGQLLVKYASMGGEIYGLDASPQMLRLARRNLSKSNHRTNLLHSSAEDLPFPNNSFPVIVATFPTNYVFEIETLEQVWRVLDPNGQLVILLAAWITGDNYLDKLAAWLFRVTGESPQQDWDQVETRYAQQLSRLSQVGYQVNHQVVNAERSKLLIIRAAKIDGLLQ
ncbi:MAG: methyltransferase domain-containing protein [Chloroflexota bacterium]|nr:MAG: methyltransferase domain-containing protein [Chloroflexota bacterium]